MAIVIFEPPAAPAARTNSPFSLVNIDGHIEDCGRLPGLMKLDGEDGIP